MGNLTTTVQTDKSLKAHVGDQSLEAHRSDSMKLKAAALTRNVHADRILKARVGDKSLKAQVGRVHADREFGSSNR